MIPTFDRLEGKRLCSGATADPNWTPDGGWTPAPAQPGYLDPTALGGLMALNPAPILSPPPPTIILPFHPAPQDILRNPTDIITSP